MQQAMWAHGKAGAIPIGKLAPLWYVLVSEATCCVNNDTSTRAIRTVRLHLDDGV